MVKRFCAALAAIMIGLTVQAQQVEQVTVGENLTYGITYNLPKTVVLITVESSCVRSVAGPFAAYAERFLGIKNAVQEDQTVWEITKVSLEGMGQADASQTYHIEFSEKGALPTFYFTTDRCLCSINRAPQDLVSMPAVKDVEITGKPVYKASDVLTGEILKAGSKVKQAELVAQEIFSIRESRSLLIKGEADNMPGDGASLQLMLDNLSAQEEALLSLFTGSSSESQHSRNFIYVPRQEQERDIAFRFSKFMGYVDKDDFAGDPYYIAIQVVEDNRQIAEPDPKKRLERGIPFCIPGRVHVVLSSAKESLAEGDMQMSQFGHVEQLPKTQFTDKKRPTSALFTPSTGAIKIFEQ